MTTTNNIILNSTEVAHKTRRIAYQIFESNSKEDEIIIAGIADNGFLFATKIAAILSEISDLKVQLCEVKINKKKPLSPITTSIKPEEYKNKSLVLVDDVLNSGTTLIYGIKHFLDVPLKRFKTAVLVNRNHKKYPVKADFKGISLSTSLKEHIVVEFKGKEAVAYLM
ncbi:MULTISPECIES: phosphoribosyltransferase family protein [Tenacibaculum]|uniref:phosphoribosyltransferase family protein n=1 Tax=Tenacibaculum TaxID=104267 RepID=UPI001F0AD0B9|nr:MULTISPECIES: phosphoribosyltransferase family protein [Tenacibaculum]MCH3882051.1 phosphoribosyltransferase [Tenacibaculum aquimarinum]MDO6599692.1 phosphoribosyltransferase family protein [Tenacibaculum sp. 1_MG-2023]